ncbi:type-F conjugative transfer system pilin assembly thiol-disulfide isomerase TrbB [Legionella gresilensis]|uniref:type-F conjugative transfer system pilin assembly thiol-disulfide isomerase TrbB n=1 Tax=Legionella gresilensis TaxID=91823 RepID=UPI0010417A39|nr:type-F conjugative transfer system pilin assembly thiol-disulfide isomerase TrbB [Legionella gresilensis]
MNASRLFMFMLVLNTFSVYAENDKWLKGLIAKREGRLKEVSVGAKKSNGFFSTHGFVFFYANTCPHCHQFAPVLKRWAKNNNATVLALSFDNKPLPEFPTYKLATTAWVNAAYQGMPIQYPALFVVNSKTKALYSVGFGSMTFEELQARLATLIPKITRYEKRGAI